MGSKLRSAGVTALVSLLLLVGVSACASGGVHGTEPDDPIGSSRDSGSAPQAFRDRDPLERCPDVRLAQGEELPPSAVSCLGQAGEEGAELAVSRPTTEGDQIVTFYRVGPGIQGTEVFTDSSADAYGSGGWTHQLCEGSVTAPGECQDQ